jgi:excisionase family DNA binding protein
MAELLTVPQVADKLQVDEETIRRWLNSGKLKGVKIGGSLWRVNESDLIEFINTKAG